MLKMKRMLSTGLKRSSATGQKLLPFLMRQRKDRLKKMETEISKSLSSGLSKIRPFLHSSERSLSASSNDPESFHCVIGPILVLAQMLGLLPVSGILKPSPTKMKFVKYSFRTIYTVSVFLMILFMAVVSILNMARTLKSTTITLQGKMGATIFVLFYGNCVLCIILFFWLSPRWVTLQREWRSMEQFIDSDKVERPKLRWRFYMISSIILVLTIVMQVLYTMRNTMSYDWRRGSENATFQNFLQIYCKFSHPFILEIVSYNYALGIVIYVTSILGLWMKSFMDVFIMLVSTGLVERYKVLNRAVMNATSKHQATIDWCGYREDYAALSCMVKKVDNDITSIIFLSFVYNLYFICFELFNGLSKMDDTIIGNVYFFGYFIFVVIRMMMVFLLTARIHDQSKVVLPALYSCSAPSYNIETERLIYLLTTDDVALTGMRFFSITRNFLLAMVGAIATYEIVLLQFNASMA